VIGWHPNFIFANGGVSMYPVLIEINGTPIYAHGFFLNLALLVCLLMVVGESRRRHWPKQEVIPITLAAFVGGMIGARFSILFFHGWEAAPFTLNFYSYFDPQVGPGSIIGGLIGAYGRLYHRRLIGKVIAPVMFCPGDGARHTWEDRLLHVR
jgi:prolipoprotein diacylglyceryltransferase